MYPTDVHTPTHGIPRCHSGTLRRGLFPTLSPVLQAGESKRLNCTVHTISHPEVTAHPRDHSSVLQNAAALDIRQVEPEDQSQRARRARLARG